MKKIVYTLLLFPMIVVGQSTNQNYVKTTNYREAGAANPQSQVTYFDGLGRPIQQIAQQQSGTGTDMITHIEYDSFGRPVKEYLPYAGHTNDMSFQPDALNATLNFSEYTGQSPYSETFFENSPLNRPHKKGAPGNDWQGNATDDNDHTIKFEYLLNDRDEVRFFDAKTTWNAAAGLYDIQLIDHGNYERNTLIKTITKDENWTGGNKNTTEEFKDKLGRVVLKRTYHDDPLDTYYVYDLYGNLTYVIPPMADNPTQQLDEFCYQYKYDYRNRMVEKKIPGKQWEFLLYDRLDRVVATGPAFTPFGGTEMGWIITKYDAFGRVAYTGWFKTSASRSTLQAQRNATNGNFSEKRVTANTVDGVSIGYTSVAFPTSGLKLLTVNYYDNYTYPNAPTLPGQIEGQTVLVNAKGLATGNWVRGLSATALLQQRSHTLYDEKSRPISSYTQNTWGGYTQIDSQLDFMGKTRFTKTFHKQYPESDLLRIVDTYSYTAQDRLLTHKQQINSLPEQLIASNTYDVLGQLVGKNVGGTDASGTTGLQKVDYRYNIRGWLTGINDEAPNIGNPGLILGSGDLFGFKINYNAVTVAANGIIESSDQSMNGAVKPLYNGNIAETFWRTKNDNVLRKYGYRYDALNRLADAYYQKPEYSNPTPGSYDENLRYDKNGNITTLKRKGADDGLVINGNIIDDLVYTYSGNQLTKVFDTSNNPAGFKDDSNGITDPEEDYKYDANGNLIRDDNKEIKTIFYNHLNLPTNIIFANGNQIGYLYTGDGTKIQKVVTENGVPAKTDYSQGFQYYNNTLKFFPHAEGYVNYTQGSYNYVFNYTDHLGNVRLSYGLDSQTHVLTILEENNYYPFGLKHTNYNNTLILWQSNANNMPALLPVAFNSLAPSLYNYKYNGKELQDELGLGVYDYGARFYDPAAPHFWQIDPKAEQMRRWSPYVYAYNNPLRFTDPDGMLPEDSIDPPGKKKTAWQQSYNPKTRNTDIGKFALIKLEQSLEGPAKFLNSINTYVKEKVGLSDKDVGTSVTSKEGKGENQKTTGNVKEHTDMTGVVESAPGSELPYSKFGNKLELAKSPFDFFESGQKAVEGGREIKKELTKEDAKPQQSEFVYTHKDNNNPNNDVRVRRDVYEAQQKKKQ